MKHRPLWSAFAALVILPSLVVACAPAEIPTDVPTRAPSTTPSSTSLPVSTPTCTPAPTEITVPTATPTLPPTATPMLGPTHTGTPTPTNPPPTPVSIPTSTPTPAPTPYARNVELVGHIGGLVSAVVAQGHYLYAGIGSELAVLDISVPERPTRVGYVVLPGLVKDIVVLGDYAYVIDGNLHIVDISNPTSPTKIGFLDTQGRSCDVATTVTLADPGKTYIYIADNECRDFDDCRGRVRMVDASDPSFPIETGSYDIPAEIRDIAASNNTVYVASSEGTWIIDVSDPLALVLIAFHGMAERIIGVETGQGYGYVIVEGRGLWVWDISDPTDLGEMGFYEFRDWCGETVYEDYRITAFGDFVYLSGCGPGIRIVDVSDPTMPQEVAFHEMGVRSSEGNPTFSAGVAVVNVPVPAQQSMPLTGDGGLLYAYISNGSGLTGRRGWVYGGISVLDMSDPTQPIEVGEYSAPGGIEDVGLQQGTQGDAEHVYAYSTAYRDGFRVVNVSNPVMPEQVGGYDDEYAYYGDTIVSGTYAYIAEGDCYFLCCCGGSVRVVDISDPVAPKEVGAYNPPGGIEDMTVGGDYLYIVSRYASFDSVQSDWTLRTVDISNPPVLVETSVYSLSAAVDTSDIAGRNRYVYRATDELLVLGFWDVGQLGTGLIVMDLWAPSFPTEIGFRTVHRSDVSVLGSTPSAGSAESPESDERIYVHIACGDGALLTVDVSDPATPMVVSVYDTLGYIRDVAVTGDYAYVVDYDRLRVIDVSNPAAPIEAGFYITSWYLRSVRVETVPASGSEHPLVYLADALGGLYILRFTPPVE